jgi:zinc/manganese transport system substrate-binding protein
MAIPTIRPWQVLAFLLGAAVIAPRPACRAQERLRVVASLTTYADIARQIGGDRADVVALGDGAENPHFVQPKPSLVLVVRRADMLVTTGLDLELWLPALLDKANNTGIASGAAGFVAVSRGMHLVEVPVTVSRSEGDTHIYGNPHVWTEPANAVVIARNIFAGFVRLDGAHRPYYERRLAAWTERLMRAYVGDTLVDLLGVERLVDLDYAGELWSFLSSQRFRGRPLTDRLGGWLRQGRVFRGAEMVCYHKEWSYFSRAFGVSCVEFIEPRPGIPPTPGHVARVISLMQERGVRVLLSTNYFDRQQVRMVASRTGATPVIVPSNVDGGPHTATYIDLVTLWVTELARAFSARAPVADF